MNKSNLINETIDIKNIQQYVPNGKPLNFSVLSLTDTASDDEIVSYIKFSTDDSSNIFFDSDGNFIFENTVKDINYSLLSNTTVINELQDDLETANILINENKKSIIKLEEGISYNDLSKNTPDGYYEPTGELSLKKGQITYLGAFPYSDSPIELSNLILKSDVYEIDEYDNDGNLIHSKGEIRSIPTSELWLDLLGDGSGQTRGIDWNGSNIYWLNNAGEDEAPSTIDPGKYRFLFRNDNDALIGRLSYFIKKLVP